MNEIVLSLRAVKKSYKKQKVLNGIDMDFEKGRIYGLIGPNGVGKTTLLRILCGLTKEDSGEIDFRDNDSEKTIGNGHCQMGCIVERPYLDESMNAIDNMRLIGYLKGVEDRSKLQECLVLVGLKDEAKKVKHFSLGMKQRLGIARLLIDNPRILFLDEPMNGLDPEGVMQLRHLLHTLAKTKNVTIVLTSHILTELEKVCDAYYFMNSGKVVKYIDTSTNEKAIDLEQAYVKYIMTPNAALGENS